MSNRSFIKWFRIGEVVIFQYIDLSNDTVIFTDDSDYRTVCTVDSSGYTKYFSLDNKAPLQIGKFRYNDKYFIRFVFDEKFLNKNPSIVIKEFDLETKDFIEAEQITMVKLHAEYPNIFSLELKQPLSI